MAGFSFSKILKASGNEFLTKAGDARGVIDEWISTGSYSLNALVSGDIFKGIPNNRAIMFAGEESVGKTLFTQFICKQSMSSKYRPLYFDTEGSVDETAFTPQGFVKNKDYEILPIKTIEDLRIQAYKMIDAYKEYYQELTTPEAYAAREKLLFVVDSIGMLTSNSAMKNLDKGEVKRDMSKQQLLRELFRDITMDMSVLKIPMILVNHTYDAIGAYVPTKVVSGGGGAKYGASTIISLTKTKARDKDKKQVGVIIKARATKSRFIRENKEVEMYLDFNKGLNPYYGLDQFLVDESIIARKSSNRNDYYLIYKGKTDKGDYPLIKNVVWKEPDVVAEILPLINEKVKAEFCFGEGENAIDDVFDDNSSGDLSPE